MDDHAQCAQCDAVMPSWGPVAYAAGWRWVEVAVGGEHGERRRVVRDLLCPEHARQALAALGAKEVGSDG